MWKKRQKPWSEGGQRTNTMWTEESLLHRRQQEVGSVGRRGNVVHMVLLRLCMRAVTRSKSISSSVIRRPTVLIP